MAQGAALSSCPWSQCRAKPGAWLSEKPTRVSAGYYNPSCDQGACD
eukprot:CAMPEP_0182526356 /NCGR_PEP_ID=MMETSP1323-20130603/3120_1 /TAXON_ID=236787 /ORGANISM="Florenciella parvula, Strain RCC1693" /LENGTH=45 /DNA_ID= /DNA_START= /DNA_END= /DNA_ORIENTATION=